MVLFRFFQKNSHYFSQLFYTYFDSERIGRKPRTIFGKINEGPEKFLEWTKQKDPDGIAWQRSEQKQGKSYLFFPVHKTEKEEIP